MLRCEYLVVAEPLLLPEMMIFAMSCKYIGLRLLHPCQFTATSGDSCTSLTRY
jgi:hypothetical protein